MKNKINQKETKNNIWLLKYIGIAVGVVLHFSWSAKAASFVVLQQELQEQTFKEITGIVKTEYGDPIPGVDVKLKGTNIEAETNIEGWYNLKANEGDKIQFVFEGFKTTIVTVGKSNILNVTIIENYRSKLSSTTVTSTIKCGGFPHHRQQDFIQQLGQVPLNIATEQPKAESVFSIDPNLINRGRPNLQLTQLLQGQVILQNIRKVEPDYKKPEINQNPETILKDVEALTRNDNYTYVVDGVRVSEETFRSLNQNDIESVDIYKHSDITRAMHGNKESQNRVEFKLK